MPHPWALPAALIFGTYGSALSIYTFLSPLPAARLFGLDISPSFSPRENPAHGFVPVFGGRNLALGLMILAFYMQRMPRAVGTVLMCMTAAGTVDTVVMALWGMEGKAWVHGIGTVMMGMVGWGLLV
ncbi:hypothetical protein MMC24_006727 [Lignoscripta atroalba]|nr:hypothetical protein [Lignoscripta atroalba]